MAAEPDRRRFLRRSSEWVAAAMLIGSASSPAAAAPAKGPPRPEDVHLPAGGKMPRRRLGRTGVEVSLLGLGGYHIGLAPDEAAAIRIVRTALDHGLDFLDNCWDYHDGKSERWMGRALRDGYRQRAFLMTKIDGRTRKAAAQQIDQSLQALETDVIDLMQIHEVIRPTDPDRVFGPDGAIEALVAARKAGKIRFIGFTGHKSPAIHLKMLETAARHGFTFDSVQMPVNVMDAHYDSFAARVIPAAASAGVGVLGMKPLGAGLFFQSLPLARGAVTPTECLQYAMSLPTSVVITGCDSLGVLMQGLDAALRFRPMSGAEQKTLLARTAPAGAKGELERYKTSQDFDGTARNPSWLETASRAG
jgi:aryl-alcohol dehydrogenase-like predicted oxidoreductase